MSNWPVAQMLPFPNYIGSGSVDLTDENAAAKSHPTSSIQLQEDHISRSEIIQLSVMELPEMIYVETRFITQATATVAKAGVKIGVETSPTPKLVASPPPVKVFTTDAAIITDSPYPMRERGQQTEDAIKTSVTVSTQCNLDEDFDFIYETKHLANVADSFESDVVRFHRYVKDKTLRYGNGKAECLSCGEVAASMQAMTSHMAMHWGPPALCHSCGLQFEHAKLLAEHRCEMARKLKSKRTANNYFKHFNCPYYRCRVTTISRLELYDHINEHSAQCCYHCSGCQRNFTTACELYHHLPLQNKACKQHKGFPYGRTGFESKRDSAYRVRVHRVYSQKKKRVSVKSFLSLRMRSRHLNTYNRRCQLCLKFCSNDFKFKAHTKRCLKYFLYRLQRKRCAASPAALQSSK